MLATRKSEQKATTVILRPLHLGVVIVGTDRGQPVVAADSNLAG